VEMKKRRRRARTALVEADEGRAPAARRGARARRTRGDETTSVTDDILALMVVVRIHVVVPLARAYGAAPRTTKFRWQTSAVTLRCWGETEATHEKLS